MGVLSSSDGGLTWTFPGPSDLDGMKISALRVSNVSATDLVVAAKGDDDYALFGFPPPLIARGGIYRSANGGASWARQLEGYATDVITHPTDFTKQYAAFRSDMVPGQPPGGVVRTLDGGVIWLPVDGPWNIPPQERGEIRFAVAPSDPNVLYVSVRRSWNKYSAILRGLWRTTNAWADTPDWTELPTTGLEAGGYLDGLVMGYPRGDLITRCSSTAWTRLSSTRPASVSGGSAAERGPT